MQVNALSQSLSAQTMMGGLLVKVLGQTTEIAKEQALLNLEQKIQDSAMEPILEVIEGLGENVDISA